MWVCAGRITSFSKNLHGNDCFSLIDGHRSYEFGPKVRPRQLFHLCTASLIWRIYDSGVGLRVQKLPLASVGYEMLPAAKDDRNSRSGFSSSQVILVNLLDFSLRMASYASVGRQNYCFTWLLSFIAGGRQRYRCAGTQYPLNSQLNRKEFFMADKPYVNPFEDVHKKALAVRDRTRKIREIEAGLRAKDEERKDGAAKDEKEPPR